MRYTTQYISCDDEVGKTIAFRLRHKIFCEQINMIPPNDTGMESDEYDINAEHLLVLEDSVPMGVCRVVRRPKLPFHDGVKLYKNFEYLRSSPNVVEVSRLGAVTTRMLDALLIGSLSLVMLNNADWWVVVIEPSLAAVLRRKGMSMVQIGDEQEWFGTRTPYLGNVGATLNQLQSSNHSVIYDGVMRETRYMRHGLA